jgi:hypothetical protein
MMRASACLISRMTAALDIDEQLLEKVVARRALVLGVARKPPARLEFRCIARGQRRSSIRRGRISSTCTHTPGFHRIHVNPPARGGEAAQTFGVVGEVKSNGRQESVPEVRPHGIPACIRIYTRTKQCGRSRNATLVRIRLPDRTGGVGLPVAEENCSAV